MPRICINSIERICLLMKIIETKKLQVRIKVFNLDRFEIILLKDLWLGKEN